MRRRMILVVSFIAVAYCQSGQALSVWSFSDAVEKRVATADLVVVGSLRDIMEGETFDESWSTDYWKYRIDTGKLEVAQVLKGTVPDGGVTLAFHTFVQPEAPSLGSRTVLVAWPPSDGPAQYEAGDTGIWLLHKDKTEPYFWASQSDDRRDLDDLPLVRWAVHYAKCAESTGIRPTLKVKGHYRMFPEETLTLEIGLRSTGTAPLALKRQHIRDIVVHLKDDNGEYLPAAKIGLMFDKSGSLVIGEGTEAVLATVELTFKRPGCYSVAAEVHLSSANRHERLTAWGPAMRTPEEEHVTIFDRDRFAYLSETGREVVEAWEFGRGDDRDAIYAQAIRKARNNLTQEMVNDIVGLMGTDDYKIWAEWLLTDIYSTSSRIEEEPSFLRTASGKRKALAFLVDSLGKVTDQYGLEAVLELFLRTSGIEAMKVEVPEIGRTFGFEAYQDSYARGYGDLPGSDVDPSSIHQWAELAALQYRCQEWCRARLDQKLAE